MSHPGGRSVCLFPLHGYGLLKLAAIATKFDVYKIGLNPEGPNKVGYATVVFQGYQTISIMEQLRPLPIPMSATL